MLSPYEKSGDKRTLALVTGYLKCRYNEYTNIDYFEIMSQSNINRFTDCVTNCCNHILKIVELVKLSMWILPSILSFTNLGWYSCYEYHGSNVDYPFWNKYFFYIWSPAFLPSFLPYTAFVKLKGVGVNHKIKLATIALVVVERFRGNQWDMHNFELKRSQMTVIYTPHLYL